jgi:hypothetical protein
MSNDFELLGRLLLAAGLRTHMLLTIGPACSRGQHLGDRLGRGAIGAGSYVLGIGGAVLVVGTLFGLRRVSGVLQRWGGLARGVRPGHGPRGSTSNVGSTDRHGQARPRRSGSSAGSQVRPTRKGPKRP